jgi:hypothetical protein
MQWNLEELRNRTAELFGETQKELLSPCLQSVFDRQDFARIYFHLAKDTLNDYLGDDTEPSDLIKLVLRPKFDGWTDWDECQLKVRAHIISCLSNLHIVSDTLGHVIYYVLGLNFEPATKIAEHRISLRSVKKKISESKRCGRINELMNSLLDSDTYEYLNAIVNHSKHRSIVEPFFNLNMRAVKGNAHEIWLREFKYADKDFDRRLAFAYLEKEFDRQSELIIKLGSALNETLEKRLLQNM